MNVNDIQTDDCSDSQAVLCVKEPTMGADMLYAGIGVGVFVMLTVLVVLTCCCIHRKRSKKGTNETILADGYSEALDYITPTDPSPIRPPGGARVEYADPDDVVRGSHAIKRLSIMDGEYDTLNRRDMQTQHTVERHQHTIPQHCVNAYSHVDIVNISGQRSGAEIIYDVSSYTLKKHATAQNQNDASDTYGNIQIQR